MADYTKAERKRLNKLVGKKVVKTDYDPKDEGVYILTFDDGTVASFSSSGDDATFTTFGFGK